MLTNILLVFHVLVAIAMVALILIQQGKGADAGAAFGSGASGTVFGSQGSASFLSRATAILATLFFILSLSLAYLVNQGSRESTSVIDQAQQKEQVQESAPPAGATDEETSPVPVEKAVNDSAEKKAQDQGKPDTSLPVTE